MMRNRRHRTPAFAKASAGTAGKMIPALHIRELADPGKGKKVVYISGKIAGLPFKGVFEKFKRRETELKKHGVVVINPVDLVAPGASWRNAMRICISFLPFADFIDLLPDWSDSPGAKLEMLITSELGIPVFVEPKIQDHVRPTV